MKLVIGFSEYSKATGALDVVPRYVRQYLSEKWGIEKSWVQGIAVKGSDIMVEFDPHQRWLRERLTEIMERTPKRHIQIGMKVTSKKKEQLNRLKSLTGLSYTEIFERALDAFEAKASTFGASRRVVRVGSRGPRWPSPSATNMGTRNAAE